MIIPDISYEWLTCRVSRLPHGGLSSDVLARIDADRQHASTLPLIERNIPVDWTHDSSVRRRFKGHTYRLRRAWRQFAALRFNGQDVYIEVFSGFGFAPGFGFKDLRIYIDGALVGRAWQGACSLGFGGRGGPAVAMLRDGRALRIALLWGMDEKPEVLELLGRPDALVLPLRIDIDAFIVMHTGIVLDRNNKFLVEYDTIEEAEVFVACILNLQILDPEVSAELTH